MNNVEFSYIVSYVDFGVRETEVALFRELEHAISYAKTFNVRGSESPDDGNIRYYKFNEEEQVMVVMVYR